MLRPWGRTSHVQKLLLQPWPRSTGFSLELRCLASSLALRQKFWPYCWPWGFSHGLGLELLAFFNVTVVMWLHLTWCYCEMILCCLLSFIHTAQFQWFVRVILLCHSVIIMIISHRVHHSVCLHGLAEMYSTSWHPWHCSKYVYAFVSCYFVLWYGFYFCY